jgi:hypothetical protein
MANKKAPLQGLSACILFFCLFGADGEGVFSVLVALVAYVFGAFIPKALGVNPINSAFVVFELVSTNCTRNHYSRLSSVRFRSLRCHHCSDSARARLYKMNNYSILNLKILRRSFVLVEVA